MEGTEGHLLWEGPGACRGRCGVVSVSCLMLNEGWKAEEDGCLKVLGKDKRLEKREISGFVSAEA